MFIYIILLSLNLGVFLILLILLERRCCGISDLSRCRLKYQFGKNLQRRPTSAEYELHKNLRVGWDYQLHKPLRSIMCQPTAQAQGLDQQEALGVPKIPEMFNG